MTHSGFVVLLIMVGIIYTISVVLLYFSLRNEKLTHVVTTALGDVEGIRSEDEEYVMYLGIPYAKVNESNPFGASLPYPNFQETFNANDDSNVCPQVEEYNQTLVGTLDCLNLNIYVPSLQLGNKFPVLVWIHGGAFAYGYSKRWLYGPKYLVRHGIILITFNYRLGPYGFLCLGTPEISGNQGLKDQISALRWIKNNIDAFGGNKDKITIMGGSAGAFSVDFHLLFAEDDLFQNAILQSGASLSSWALFPVDKNALTKLAELFDKKSRNYSESLSFLAKIDPITLIEKSKSMSFGPCVETEFDGIERYITQYPINTNVPKVKKVPIMIGFNNLDMLGFEILLHCKLESLSVGQLVTGFNMPDQQFNEMIRIVKRFYFTNSQLTESQRWNVINMTTDLYFGYPVQRTIKKYIANEAKSIFSYIFSYKGDRNFPQIRFNLTSEGAVHSDDLGYLFDISVFSEPSARDRLMIDRMTTLWTNFVKYSDPTPEVSSLLPVKWKSVEDEDKLFYLEINKDMRMGNRAFNKEMAFWELFVSTNSAYEIGYNQISKS